MTTRPAPTLGSPAGPSPEMLARLLLERRWLLLRQEVELHTAVLERHEREQMVREFARILGLKNSDPEVSDLHLIVLQLRQRSPDEQMLKEMEAIMNRLSHPFGSLIDHYLPGLRQRATTLRHQFTPALVAFARPWVLGLVAAVVLTMLLPLAGEKPGAFLVISLGSALVLALEFARAVLRRLGPMRGVGG